MGIINHNAIIATTWNTEVFGKVSEFTKNNNPNVFLLSDKQINGYRTIVLVPDGSKEGWPESDEFDDLRDRFIKKLESCAYDDGSNPVWRLYGLL